MTFDVAEYVRQDFLERDEEGKARMFYFGPLPWHGLGEEALEPLTSTEACKKARLNDWGIHLECFTTESGAIGTDWMAIVRAMDNKVLGVAMPGWKAIQNERVFEFLDSLLQDGVMRYATAGSLMGGKKIWILCQLTEDMQVGGDVYKQYILAVVGHDRFTSIKFYYTNVRVICNNTLRVAQNSSEAMARVIHSGNINQQFNEAKRLINLTTGAQRRMTEWLEKQAAKKVSADQVTLVREEMFGSLDDATSEHKREAIANFMTIYEAEREREGRTGYALIQTVTGYADHMITLRHKDSNEEKMVSFLGGTGTQFKTKGLTAIAKTTRLAVPAGIE